jgi:PadR family transcriptional regulator AphA
MLRLAILELLDHKPLSGYELKRRFNGSIVFFWRANQSQIYRELREMEKAGVISGAKVTHEWRPTKTVYEVTPKGREELVQWLGQKPKLQAVKDEMMLKCFAFHLLPADQAEAQLVHHQKLHQQRLDFYLSLEKQLEDRHGPLNQTRDPILFWNAQCLYHAIDYERMYVEWCSRTIARHQSFEPAEPAEAVLHAAD